MTSKITDTQYTEDEMALMEGRDLPSGPEAEDTTPEPEAQAEDTTTEAAEDAAPEAEAKDEEAQEANVTGKVSSEDSEPVAEDPPIPPAPPEPTDYPAQLKALRKEARAIDAAWAAGNVDDDARSENLAALDEKIDALTRAQVKVELLADQANEAAAARAKSENAAMRAVAEAEAKALAAKQPGIDYAKDTAAAKTFDAIYGALKADPDNRGKPIADLVAEANKAVKAMRGMLTPKAAPPAPEPKPKPAIPQTLGRLPAAAAQPIGADLDAELMAIEDPDALEAKWASLPTSHRQASLRATLPAKRR